MIKYVYYLTSKTRLAKLMGYLLRCGTETVMRMTYMATSSLKAQGGYTSNSNQLSPFLRTERCSTVRLPRSAYYKVGGFIDLTQIYYRPKSNGMEKINMDGASAHEKSAILNRFQSRWRRFWGIKILLHFNEEAIFNDSYATLFLHDENGEHELVAVHDFNFKTRLNFDGTGTYKESEVLNWEFA